MNFKTKNRAVLSMGSLLVTIALAAFTNTSCNQHSQDNNTTTSTDTTTAGQTSIVDTARARADWEKFKTDARADIQKSDDSIAAFKKHVKKLNGKMKIKYERDVAWLERKDDTLKMKLDNFGYESQVKWDEFRIHFNHDMAVVKNWLKDSTDVR